MCEVFSKLEIKTPERLHSGVFIVNFEHISHLFSVSVIYFNKQVIVSCVMSQTGLLLVYLFKK